MARPDPPIDPLAQLDRDLKALEASAPNAPRYDPTKPESLIDWLEAECGLLVRRVPKIDQVVRAIVADLQARRRVRALVIGPRGGGKTMLAAALQLLSMRFFGASWTSVGGSLEQATRLFEHVRGFIARSADLQRFITEALATRIRARTGATITVHAASEKSIRGQHPRGPSGAGGIVLDEAALIEDRIIDAAIPQVASATPSMILQLSTLGELQSGRFYELTQDYAARGYHLFEFGVFDVTARCPYDCATACPVPAFAQDERREGPDRQLRTVRKALCAGKAHEPDGWLSIDEVAQQFLDLPRESFEREFLGLASRRAGAIYDPALLDELTPAQLMLGLDAQQHAWRFDRLEKAIGIDWGFSGQTAVCSLVRLKDAVVVYGWQFFSTTRFSMIREGIIEQVERDHVSNVYCDAASPSDNEELTALLIDRAARRGESACAVHPVAFGEWKTYGIGEVRRRIERALIRFPKVFGVEDVPNHAAAMKYLKGYSADANGKPIKKDDHGPDALMVACLGWSRAWSGGGRIF